MSRARNIKPGFFKNETLAECDPLARILFAGLWCAADREGRMEDRPKRLKAECLPYDECDANELLNQLAERGFIVRYIASGAKFIQIVEFLKHQNPHVRELPSSIPAPSDARRGLGNAQAQPRQRLGDAEHGTGPADSSFPFPDSSFPFPDSSFPFPDSPSREAEPKESRRSKSTKANPAHVGTRLPTDWQPTPDELRWAQDARPGLDLKVEIESFRDYWTAKPGKDGRKLDWPATFRNWIRRAKQPGVPGNRQQALEEHNRRVTSAWAAQPTTQSEAFTDAP